MKTIITINTSAIQFPYYLYEKQLESLSKLLNYIHLVNIANCLIIKKFKIPNNRQQKITPSKYYFKIPTSYPSIRMFRITERGGESVIQGPKCIS